MSGWARDLLTFISGFVILCILYILNIVVGLITGIVIGIIGIPIENEFLINIIAIVLCFVFVSLPYNILTTFFIYTTVVPLNTKRYGMLGGPIASGVLCWLFSCWTLPYVLFAKIWPVDFIPESQPISAYKTKFYIGYAIGFFFILIQVALSIAITSSPK